MVMGRPRTYDRAQVALDLIEWAKKDDSINLNGFCISYNPPLEPSKITLWARECTDFRRAYEGAKAYLGERREQRLNENKIHVKAYDLNASTYDHFLKDERKQMAEHAAALQKDSNPTASLTTEQILSLKKIIDES